MPKLKFLLFFSFIAYLVIGQMPFSAYAQEGFDDEATPIYLKKIRDMDGNYLKELTRATAKELSTSGEFIAKPFKRSSPPGPVVEVDSPSFNYSSHKDGMSTKEIADAGLGLVRDVGGLLGFDKEANKANEIQWRMNRNRSLDAWGEDEKILVTMVSKVYLTDKQTGEQITRSIKQEKVFESKNHFVKSRDKMVQDAVIPAVKRAVAEYVDDSDF